MTQTAKRAVDSSKTAPGYCSNLEAKAVAAQKQAIRLMWPGLSSRQIAAALDNRITAGNVRQWQAGIRPIPPWVKDRMRQWCADVRDALEATPAGPGSQAGWRNVAGYVANR